MENDPANPVVRTRDAAEAWWSRGHATAFEGPAGDWWLVYHGYERGFRTLGRQVLLEPIKWTDDGWFRALGGDLSGAIRKPVDLPGLSGLPGSRPGMPLSDRLAGPALDPSGPSTHRREPRPLASGSTAARCAWRGREPIRRTRPR